MSHSDLSGRWFLVGKRGGSITARASHDTYLVRFGGEQVQTLIPVSQMYSDGWQFFDSSQEALAYEKPAPQTAPVVAPARPAPQVAPQAHPQVAQAKAQPQVNPNETKKVDPATLIKRVRRD